MKKGFTLLLPVVYLVIGGLAGSTIVLWIQYLVHPTMDVPYDCILPIVYFWFGFSLLFLLPFYYLVYWLVRSARKGWAAFVAGILWYPLQVANPINCDHPSSLLVTLSSLALTAVADCLLVATMSWGVAMIGRFARRYDSATHRPPGAS